MLDTVCHYVLQWVEDNLDTGKNINDLIYSIGYSRKTVEVWFHKKYGITIGTYLFRRRMSRASVLLRLTHLSITEIATLLHYSSSQNFARTFKRFSNKSPTEYRNSGYWDVTIMQPSLLYQFDIQNAHKAKISDIFFHGKSYSINESFFYRKDMKIKGGFQKLIVDLCSLKKDDILVCVENINNVDLDKSRKGIINVSVKAGEILDKYQKEAGVMPKGEYYYADFSGSWQEYYLFTFSFFIAAVANKKYSPKDNVHYICFHPVSQDTCGFVNCTMYIPLGISTDQKDI